MKGSRSSMLLHAWQFVKENRKWTLAPLFILMLLFGVMIIVAQSSAFAPLIYTLF